MLDEGASALDPEAERDLAETLRELSRETTVIVATNGRPLLFAADRTYELDRGRVIELNWEDGQQNIG